MKDPLSRLLDVRKTHGKVPSGVTIAVDEPMEINEVMILAGCRYRVTEVLTEVEFRRRTAANKERRGVQEREGGFSTVGQFTATLSGASLSDADAATAPDPSMRYFYAMERI